jgi:hypothetical protein
MPAIFDRCVESTSKQLRKKNPSKSDKEIENSAYAICRTWYKKQYGKDPMSGEILKIKTDIDTIAQRIINGCKEYYGNPHINLHTEVIKQEDEIIKSTINRVEIVTAAKILSYDDISTAGLFTNAEVLAANLEKAGIASPQKDLLYVGYKLVHVGKNGNKDEFLDEELTKAKDTPLNKLVNWKHKEPNVGCIIYSEMVEASEKEAKHLINVGAISKLKYPEYAQEIIYRYNNGVLFASMEAIYETAKCSSCGNTYENQFLYCDHLKGRYAESSVVSRQLIGITFCGAGIAVDVPADSEAEAVSIE